MDGCIQTIRDLEHYFMRGKEVDDLVVNPLNGKQKEARLESGMIHEEDKPMDSPGAKGLCLNCDDAETCKFNGFGEKILFCEEHSSNFDNSRQNNPDSRNADIGTNFGVKRLIPGWDS
jgi:hypothetical protein